MLIWFRYLKEVLSIGSSCMLVHLHCAGLHNLEWSFSNGLQYFVFGSSPVRLQVTLMVLCRVLFLFFLKCKLSSETFGGKDYTLLASLRTQLGTWRKTSLDEWIIIIINLFYVWRLQSLQSSQLAFILSVYFS